MALYVAGRIQTIYSNTICTTYTTLSSKEILYPFIKRIHTPSLFMEHMYPFVYNILPHLFKEHMCLMCLINALFKRQIYPTYPSLQKSHVPPFFKEHTSPFCSKYICTPLFKEHKYPFPSLYTGTTLFKERITLFLQQQISPDMKANLNAE